MPLTRDVQASHLPKTVLFVGHDAYRAGAQLSLLQLLAWLGSHSDIRLLVLLKRGGQLLPEYTAIAPTQVLDIDLPSGRPHRRIFAALRQRAVLRMLSRSRVDLIYLNSVATLDLLPALARRWDCPVICHVRELEFTIGRIMSDAAFSALQKRVDTFIAVSDAVKDNLRAAHHVADSRIRRIYGALPLSDSPAPRDSKDTARVRRELGLPVDAFIVGGCGTLEWRKAPDIFLQVAGEVSRRRPLLPVHFLWVGGSGSAVDSAALRHDAERLGVLSRVHFVGAQAKPERYFALFDTFLLTSREDPFPRVCLEAAAHHVPIVCFADAGGSPEFVEDDAGFVLPYLDVSAAAAAIATLADTPHLRQQLGEHAAEKLKQAHDIGGAGAEILGEIQRLTGAPS